MIDSAIARVPHLFLLGLLLAACSTTPAPTSDVPRTKAPTSAPVTLEPRPTAEPTMDPQPLPSTSRFGWWEDSIKYCQPPAYVRIDGKVTALGTCPGRLDDSPTSLTLDVGQDIDIHMAVLHDGGEPLYPLPEAADRLVALGWFIYDRATMTYRALSPGTTRLMTTGPCWIGDQTAADMHEVIGPCPVLELQVRDIEMTCIDVASDLCRAAGAAAIRVSSSMLGPGRVAGWEVRPDSLKIEWPGCGHVVAKVTVFLRNPEEQNVVTLGQPHPDTDPLNLAWCTY